MDLSILLTPAGHRSRPTLILEICPKWLNQAAVSQNHLQLLNTKLFLNAPKRRIGTLAYQVVELPFRKARKPMVLCSAAGFKPSKQRTLVSVDNLENYRKQLQELQKKVERMIEEGDEDSAKILIEANYEAVSEQLEQGIEGLEQAQMLDVLAQLHMGLQEFQNAERILGQTMRIMEKVGSHTSLADTILQRMGKMYSAIGHKEEALLCYKKALELKDLTGEDNCVLETLLLMGSVYRDLDKGDESIQIYKKMISTIESCKGADSQDLTVPLLHLGHTLLEENRPVEADVCMNRALRIAEKLDDQNDGRVGVAICSLARVKCAKAEFNEAAGLYEKGLQSLKNSKISRSHALLETTRTEFAELLILMGKQKEAHSLWEENLCEKEKSVGPNSPELANHLQNLASSYALDWNFEEAEPLLRRSLQLLTNSLGPTASEVSTALASLASALHNLERYEEAEELSRRSLSIREANLASTDPAVWEACDLLASILHALDRDEEALSLMRRVLSIQEEVLGTDNPELCNTLSFLIELLNSLGRTLDASILVKRYQRLVTKSKAEMNLSKQVF